MRSRSTSAKPPSTGSTFDLFGIVKRIVDAKAQFRSLGEPWADTGTSTGRLMAAREAVDPRHRHHAAGASLPSIKARSNETLL